MALQLAFNQSPIGVPLDSAYARVLSIAVQPASSTVLVGVYFNTAARQANVNPVFTQPFAFVTSELKGDILPAVYAALKALPEFAGAQDC